MKQKTQAGFAHFGLMLLIVIILAAVGGSGYYVWHKNHDQKKASATSSSQQAAKPATPAITTYDECTKAAGSIQQETFPLTCVTKSGQHFTQATNNVATIKLTNSNLSFDYDKATWKIEDAKSDSDTNCGPQDFATLTDAKSTTLTFALGACGKGGGGCFGDPSSGCIAQSKELAQVKLSANETAYVLAQRTTIDNGKTWSYNVWLSDAATCTGDICAFTAQNLKSNPSTINAQLDSASAPTSLDEFASLVEVKAVTAILETVHY